MEDTDELLEDLRIITKYFIDSDVGGYAVELDDALYMANLFKQLDDALRGGDELPDGWSH